MALRRRLVTIAGMWHIRILIMIGIALAVLQPSATPAGKPLPATIAPELPFSGIAQPAPGTFLVSRRSLDGTYFGQTVIYLVEHDAQGSLGLIVNRSSEIPLGDALSDIDPGQAAAHRLYYGGPVEPAKIMMLLRGQSAASGALRVDASVYFSTDREVLDAALAANKTASEIRLYLGYAGWAAGQLNYELKRGSWFVVAASADAVFSDESDSLWQRLIERLEPEGIEVRQRHRQQTETAA